MKNLQFLSFQVKHKNKTKQKKEKETNSALTKVQLIIHVFFSVTLFIYLLEYKKFEVQCVK